MDKKNPEKFISYCVTKIVIICAINMIRLNKENILSCLVLETHIFPAPVEKVGLIPE